MTEQQARELNDLLHEVRFSNDPFGAKYKVADWIDKYTAGEVNKISSNPDVIKSVCTCTTLTVPPQTINGVMTCMNCEKPMVQTVL